MAMVNSYDIRMSVSMAFISYFQRHVCSLAGGVLLPQNLAMTVLVHFPELRQFPFQGRRPTPSAAGISKSRGPEHHRARARSWESGDLSLVLTLDLQSWCHLGTLHECSLVLGSNPQRLGWTNVCSHKPHR